MRPSVNVRSSFIVDHNQENTWPVWQTFKSHIAWQDNTEWLMNPPKNSAKILSLRYNYYFSYDKIAIVWKSSQNLHLKSNSFLGWTYLTVSLIVGLRAIFIIVLIVPEKCWQMTRWNLSLNTLFPLNLFYKVLSDIVEFIPEEMAILGNKLTKQNKNKLL